MAFSKQDFISGYVAEIGSHIENVNFMSFSLNFSKDRALIKDILTLLRTIKTASKMMDFYRMATLAEKLEAIFMGLEEEKYEATLNIFNLVFKTCGFMRRLLQTIEEKGDDDVEIDNWIDALERASSGYFFDIEKLGEISSDDLERKYLPASEKEMAEGEMAEPFVTIKSVEIEIEKVNEVIKTFDKLIMRQFLLKRDIEKFERDFAVNIPRGLKEELSSAEVSLLEAQRQVVQFRLVPLQTIFTPLKGEIEREVKRLSKNVRVEVRRNPFLLDKNVLDQLRIVLIQLAKNCLAYGIEDEQTRVLYGKKPRGLVLVEASQDADRVTITVRDDGRGIQYENIREKAIEMFQSKRVEIESLPDNDLQQFIFMPGFMRYTADPNEEVPYLRLDLVRSCMEKIKGKIRIETKKHAGTSFILTVPLSSSSQAGLFAIAGNKKVMIPSNYIERVSTSSEENFVEIQGKTFINVNDSIFPLYFLSTILETEKGEKNDFVIIIEYLETKIALIVDEIEKNRTAMSSPLPGILKKMSSLQGIVYDENYSLVPVLDIPFLIQKIQDFMAYDAKRYEARNRKHKKRILVAEDSDATRQIEQEIFESAGFLVDTARDGVEALEKLGDEKIDAVVTDMTMPRMDGRTFLRNVKNSPQFREIPVVVVSGAYDDQEEKKILDFGARAFVNKVDFKRDNLLHIVKELLNER